MSQNGSVPAQLLASADLLRAVAESSTELLEQAAGWLIQCLQAGGKVLICGNGGSAADAMHIATEFLARYKAERRALPAIALGIDPTFTTAIGNDGDFSDVFARQVEGLGKAGDVLWALSTSGNSTDVVKAVDAGRGLGLRSIAFTGETGGRLLSRVDLCFRVPSADTPRIQEVHIAAAHVICDLVERAFLS